MKKRYPLGAIVPLLFLLAIKDAKGQSSAVNIQTVGSRQYYLMDNRWKFYDPIDGQLYKTDSSISVQYSTAATAAGIAALEGTHGLIRRNVFGPRYIRYAIPAIRQSNCRSLRFISREYCGGRRDWRARAICLAGHR